MASDDTEKKLDMSLDQIVQENKAEATAANATGGKAKSTKRAERIAQSSPYQARHGRHGTGCGIVTYATEEAAQNAIATLNDTELGGRKIFVREDREAQTASTVKPKRGFRVYVGNLSWNVKWQELKDHMKKAGTVVHADVLEEANGRSKGCGLVEYATQEEAAKAIAELNNTELEGRLIFVREDREPEGGSISKFAKRAAAPRGNGEGRQLYVGNLPWETNWQQLKDLFRTVGDVERADIAEYPDGRSRGFGIIRYTNAADAWQAIERLNGLEIEGRLIEVRLDKRE
ncbi:RNA binding protein [Phytophthora palmivora]|uniref:RNA binding protein n=1 Tax=Phytophthora palmivora TaxID=4796 RepID=A0A2P4X091_9STRA|nr:RNA binding protein [Phytophthora palmivora]